MPEFGTNDLEFRFVEYDINMEHKKYDLYQKKINIGVMTPEMIAEEEGIDVEKVRQAQEEKQAREDEVMQKQNNFNNEGKKALLIKEVPDDIDDEIDFEVGDRVRVVNGSEAFKDKIGKVEKVVNKDAIIVRFDVGVDVFNSEQLVFIDMENTGTSEIKSKDPFNTTDLERKLLRNIAISGKKIRKALRKLQ